MKRKPAVRKQIIGPVYLKIGNKKVAKSKECQAIIDLDSHGRVVGIELLQAIGFINNPKCEVPLHELMKLEYKPCKSKS